MAAAGLLVISLLGVPYAGLLIFSLGAGLTYSGATVAASAGVSEGQAGLGSGLINTAMETGPPVGLSVLVTLASAYSSHPAAGYSFAFAVAAAVLALTASLAGIARWRGAAPPSRHAHRASP
jgi:hypothetical protein